jgi:RiboL-PSP-HEPN
MYGDIDRELTQRLAAIRENIDYISSQIPSPPVSTPRYFNSQKGLIFVQLYGIVEYLVNQTVPRTASILTSENLDISKLSPYVWSVVFESNLESLRTVNREKWEHRHKMFKVVAEDNKAVIPEDVLPTNGLNITQRQLECIWKTYNIREPVFSELSFGWRLKDIVLNRNDIAHGNKTAAEVGMAFTITDLYDRLNDVSRYCSYAIGVFENYISNKDYLA